MSSLLIPPRGNEPRVSIAGPHETSLARQLSDALAVMSLEPKGARHHRNRKIGSIGVHEPEDPEGRTPVSRAN